MSRIYWTRDIGPTAVFRAIEHMDSRGVLVRTSLIDVQGISLGGCVEAVGTERKGAMRRKAHAHTGVSDAYRGWLCFLSDNPDRLVTATGKPTRLLWHEWAHLFANAGHTQRFRDLLTAVGQRGAIR